MTQTVSSSPTSLFARVRVIMVNPSHPGNVGATARAIKAMGFSQLMLVAPQRAAMTSNEQAIAMASGAKDVLGAAVEHANLQEALKGTTLAFALTARPRELGPPTCDIREAAQHACEHLCDHDHHQIAMVLGTERSGLSNQHIALCHRLCHIPANPEYSSLNVAQAAQLVAWELRYAFALASATPLLPSTYGADEPGSKAATHESVDAFLAHLETALIHTGFIDPDHPGRVMTRMRHLFMRCGLSQDETSMLRGVCTEIIRSCRKQGS